MKSTTNNTRKSQAARENGRKSKGPITPAGKAKSKFNALRHGYTSHRAVLLSTESEEDLRAFSQAYFDTLQPANALEALKVEEIIAAEWRLRRILNAETTLLDCEIANVQSYRCSIEPVDDNLHTALALLSLTAFPGATTLAETISQNGALPKHSPGGQPMLLQRYARSLAYQANRAFHQLRLLQAERRRQPPIDDEPGNTQNERNEPKRPTNEHQPIDTQPFTDNPDTPKAMRYRYKLRCAAA